MVIKKITRKSLSLLLAFLMVFTMLPTTTLAASTDITGHWAEETLQKWSDLGWFNGDGQGVYRPDTGITRAEFMSLVNRMKEYTDQSADMAKYTDVSADKWYYNAVSAALAAGYITGTGDTIISPEKPITRQEAMTIIARISDVTPGDTSVLSAATDGDQVDSWAQNTVAACINEGLVAGADGKINPRANITRAESVVLMDRIYSNVRTYAFAGTYGPESGTLKAEAVNVVGADVKLRNVTVAGDLTIGAAVGNGEVYLEGVTVNGSLNVHGGGMDSVYLDNCNIKELIVTKDAVRIVLDNGSVVSFARVEGEDDFIELKGNTTIETLTIIGEDTRIAAGANVSIKTLNAEADGITVETQSGTTIGTANITGETEITGAGKITTANIKSEGVVIETKPTTTNVDSGLTANVGGANVTGGTLPGGGGGGGSSTTVVNYQSHNAADKTVPFGTPQGDLNLPVTVRLTADTGAEGTADVAWNYGTYNSGESGTYTLTGTLSNASVTWAPATISVTVTVQEALTVTGGTDVPEFVVKSGTSEADAKAKLPQSLVLTISDNSTVLVGLVWTIQDSYADTAGANNTFKATISGLPANIGVVPEITGTVIIAESDTPVASSVTLTATPQSVQRPTDSTNATVTLSAEVKDQFGDAFVGATLNYALKETYMGVSYGLEIGTPTITITQGSTDSSVNAVVEVDGTSITDEVVVYITDEVITATSIEVSNFVSSMILPVGGQTTEYEFRGVIKDQNDAIMAGESIEWSLKTPVTGVNVTANGLVTVSDQASNGAVFTVVANYGILGAVEKTVTVVKAMSVLSSISQVDGSDSVTLPVLGAGANTAQYTADALDQYGIVISIAPNRIQWRVNANGIGVSVDGEGLVSVQAGSSATSMDVNAFIVLQEGVSGEEAWDAPSTLKSPTKVVAIIKDSPVAASVTITPSTANVVIPASGTATQQFAATVIDQYGDVISSPTITWSVTNGAGVSISTNGLLTITSAASAGSVTVTAQCGDKTGTVTVTITGASSEGYKVTLINNDEASGTLKAYNVVDGLAASEIPSSEKAAAANRVAFQVEDIHAEKRIKDVEINGESNREGFLIGAMGYLATTLRQDTTVEVFFEGIPGTLPLITGVTLYSDPTYDTPIAGGTIIAADATIYAQGTCDDETFCIWEYADTADATNWTTINWWKGHYQLQLANADGVDLSGKYIRVRSTGLPKYSTGQATSSVHQVMAKGGSGGGGGSLNPNKPLDPVWLAQDNRLYASFTEPNNSQADFYMFNLYKDDELVQGTAYPNIPDTTRSVMWALKDGAGEYIFEVEAHSGTHASSQLLATSVRSPVMTVSETAVLEGFSVKFAANTNTLTAQNTTPFSGLIMVSYDCTEFEQEQTYQIQKYFDSNATKYEQVLHTSPTSVATAAVHQFSNITVNSDGSGSVTVSAVQDPKITVEAGGTEPPEKLETHTGVKVHWDNSNSVWVYWDAANGEDEDGFDDRAYWLHAIPDGAGSERHFGTMEPAFKNEFFDDGKYYTCLNIEVADLLPGTYTFEVTAYKEGYGDSERSATSTDKVQIAVESPALNITGAVYDEESGELTITSGETLTADNCYMIYFYGEEGVEGAEKGSIPAYVADVESTHIVLDTADKVSWIEDFSQVKSIAVTTWTVAAGADPVKAVITYTPKQTEKIMVTVTTD